jgi:hypothetical protein
MRRLIPSPHNPAFVLALTGALQLQKQITSCFPEII